MLFSSKNLTAGLILSEELILDKSESFKYPVGHVLTNRDIVRIIERGIAKVNIQVGDRYNTFNSSFNQLVSEVISSNDFARMQKLSEIYEEIIKENDILQFDVGTILEKEKYNHLVNTINITAIVTSKYNDLAENSIPIKDIILSAIMQDIGRNAKDPYILSHLSNKYSHVIEELIQEYPNINADIFKKYDSKYHPVYSYLISLNYDINDNIRKAILLHHEKEYGENSLLGMPLNTLSEDEPYVVMAKILKLADIYDILIAKNIDDNPDVPFKDIGRKIDKMVASGFVNARMTNILKNMIPIYQVGMKVLLSDGTIGLIASNDANNYNNPIVTDLKGEYIDLEKEQIMIIRHYYD